MQTVSYMGDGVTTEFNFNFPYFENTNIIVTKNGAAATGYSIVGTSGGLDADFPYIGGKVVFEVAPTALDSVTIARSLPLQRIVDHQQLVDIQPDKLNLDTNYLMEVIKDLHDELESLRTQYAEIADKESTSDLLSRITTIHNEIVAVSAQITALGDISTLRSDVTTNTENIGTNAGAITSLRDAANFTATGKAAISHLAMPSSTYDELTFGASGTTYTAPADGWFAIKLDNSGLTNHWVNVYLNDLFIANFWAQVSNNSFGLPLIPCAKGGKIKLNYGSDIKNTSKIRFIYATSSAN